MNYIDIFPMIAVGWGVLSLFCIRFGEDAPRQYNKLTIVLLALSWGYLMSCAPLFREHQYIAPQMETYIAIVAALLSIEVWFIFISTLLAVGLAKKAHDPENKAFLPDWHLPIRKFFIPGWQLIAVANIVNAAYYFFVDKLNLV